VDDKNQMSSGSDKQAEGCSSAHEDTGKPLSLLCCKAPRNGHSTPMSFSKRSDTRNGATWRTACTFSLLALLTTIALTRSNWPFTGPAGTLAESILSAAVWLSIFAQCTSSVYLAGAALKRYRRDRDLVQSALAAVALVMGGAIILLVYSRLWI